MRSARSADAPVLQHARRLIVSRQRRKFSASGNLPPACARPSGRRSPVPPAAPAALRAQVADYLAAVVATVITDVNDAARPQPKLLITPHAGPTDRLLSG